MKIRFMKKGKLAALLLMLATLLILPQVVGAADLTIGSRSSTMYMQYYSSGWNNMDTPQHYVVGTSPERVSYCVAHRKTSPSSGGTGYNGNDVLSNYSNTTQLGLLAILESGYPFETNGLSADEARYATANAIRFWLSEREYYEGGTDLFYNYTDLHGYDNGTLAAYAAAGLIPSKVRTRAGYNNGVLQFAIQLLIKARNQEILNPSITYSPSTISLGLSGSYFVGSTTVVLSNCKTYNINTAWLPPGTAVYGYTGNNGDVLTFYIPISSATAGGTFGLPAAGIDNRTRSNIFVVKPVSSSYQDTIYTTQDILRETAYQTLTIYTPAMPDLQVSLTPGKSVYNPGETVAVTATIYNGGNGAVGSAQVSLSPSGYTTQVQTVAYIAPYSSAATTFFFTAANYTTYTNVPITGMVDPNNYIAELNEGNNTNSTNIGIYAAKPDLIVSTLATNKTTYEAGEIINVTATVKNQGYTTAGASTLSITPSGLTAMTADIPALGKDATNAVQTFTFTAPEPLTATQLKIIATADSNNVVNELVETNNTKEVNVSLQALKPDFTFGDQNTIVSSYYAGNDIVIATQVRNLTAQGAPTVDVRLQLGTATKTEAICVPGTGTNIVVFRITAPAATGAYPVLMTIDPDNKIVEKNESNNNRNQSGTIKFDGSNGAVTTTSIAVVRNDVPDPQNAQMEAAHLSRGKKAAIVPTFDNSNYHTWTEIRYEGGSYVQKSYWARLTTTFSISPDPRVFIKDHPDMMESGFGIAVTATTTVTTNYDNPQKLVGPQMFWVFYPETGYWADPEWSRYAESLEALSGTIGGLNTVNWQYAVSPYSPTTSRLHYTPVWFPDGLYEAVGQSFYAWSPAGQMYQQASDTVEIDGDMYDRFPILNH